MSSRYLSHYLESSSATSADIGQATETDTALPVGRSKSRALGIAVDTNEALPVGRLKTRIVGEAQSTETAQPVSGSKSYTIGQAVEVSTAQPVGRVKAATVGQAVETDTATAVARSKAMLLGQAVEPDTALPLDLPVPVVERTGGWWPLVAILHEIRTERARETGQPAVLDDWDRHAAAARRHRPGRRLVAPIARRVPTACPNDGEPLVRGPGGELRCPFDGWTPTGF